MQLAAASRIVYSTQDQIGDVSAARWQLNRAGTEIWSLLEDLESCVENLKVRQA